MLQRLDTTDRPERPDGAPTPPPERPRVDLNIPRVLAGALAAASAAVAASWLGVAGTVVGAVVASVVVSGTTALDSHPLERSSEVIREVIPVTPGRYRTSDATSATERLVIDRSEPEQATPDSPVVQRRPRRIRWATVALSSIVMLILGFGAITGVEA